MCTYLSAKLLQNLLEVLIAAIGRASTIFPSVTQEDCDHSMVSKVNSGSQMDQNINSQKAVNQNVKVEFDKVWMQS